MAAAGAACFFTGLLFGIVIFAILYTGSRADDLHDHRLKEEMRKSKLPPRPYMYLDNDKQEDIKDA